VLDLSVTISPDHQIIRSPDHPITRSPDHPITRSPDGFQSPDYPITRFSISLAVSPCLRGRCCFWFSISRLPDFPITRCVPPGLSQDLKDLHTRSHSMLVWHSRPRLWLAFASVFLCVLCGKGFSLGFRFRRFWQSLLISVHQR
jgi:hypothetical protein